jgi:hypothetical protein
MKKNITLLVDDEIDDQSKQTIQSHIENCSSCLNEYIKIVTMRKLMNSDPYLNNLKSKNISLEVFEKMNQENINSKSKYSKGIKDLILLKKKFIAACIVGILIGCSFIPVNGKSLSKSMGNWLKEIQLKYTIDSKDGNKIDVNHTLSVDKDRPGSLQSIYDEMDKALLEAHEITDPEDRQKRIEEIYQETNTIIENKIAEDEQRLLEQNTIVYYNSIEEARNNIPISFPVPKYIPDGFIFDKVEYSKHESGTFEMVRFFYKRDNELTQSQYTLKYNKEDSLLISYVLNDMYIKDSTSNQVNIKESFNQNTKVEEIIIQDIPGFMLIERRDKYNSLFMSLTLLCDNYRISTGMSIHSLNIDNEMESVKTELVKIIEAYITQ